MPIFFSAEDGTLASNPVMRHAHYNIYGNNVHANQISFKAQTNMDSVVCFAPVWNSSVWITKIQYLYVNGN